MSGTCKACGFWASVDGRIGNCGRWMTGYHVRSEEIPDNEVLVEDDEGWGARMGRDFGCVLFEPTKSAGE